MYNMSAGYGLAQVMQFVGNIIPIFGRVLIVMRSTDPNYVTYQRLVKNDPDGRVRLFSTLESAYAEMTTNRNDVCLLSGYSSFPVASMLTVAKNRCHFIGMDGGDRMIQQGALIGLETASTDAVATLKVTGVRNTFRNLKFSNSGTHANSVSAVLGDGDEGTLWKNCSFMKLSDLNVATVSDFEIRSDSANFIDCEFGFDTLTQSAARPTLWAKASGSTRMKDCRFRKCRFVSGSSSADKLHFEVEDTNSLLFQNLMEDCTFMNSLCTFKGDVIATNAVASASGLVEGSMLFVNPACNSTNFSTTSDQFKVTLTPTATTNAFEGVTPA